MERDPLLLDLPKLRMFVAVARTESFTRAADELGLRQPTISQQIRGLEDGIGTRLFERLGRSVRLTPAGVALLSYAERILDLAQEAQVATREAAGQSARTLRLGVGNTLATYVLPDLLARLRWEQPDIVVQITVGNTEQLIEAVLDTRVELALVGSPIADGRLIIQSFLTDDLVMIEPPDGPWRSKQSVDLASLATQTLFVREPGSAIYASIAALLSERQIVPAHTITLGNLEAIKRSVEVGLGVAIVPEIAVRREQEAGTLHTLTLCDVHEERTFNYIYRQRRSLSPVAQIFVALLHKPFE